MNVINDTIKKMKKALFHPDNKLSLIPNWMSFSRAIGGVAIPIMAYSGTSLPVFITVATFLGLSDFLDGKIARKVAKEETEDGALLDAVSDKIFSILLTLGIVPLLPIFTVNIILESIISFINAKNLSMGGESKSNFIGKVKTWPLFTALLLGYLALVIQNLNIAGITNETLLLTSTVLSGLTIPLELATIKTYHNSYKNTEVKEEVLEDTKKITKEEVKKPKFKLSKDYHPAITYELPKEKEKSQEFTKVKKL